MPKKKEKPATMTFTRKVIAKGVSEDLCDLGPGVLYQDEIVYTNDRPGPFLKTQRTMLAAQVQRDVGDLMAKIYREWFTVEIEPKEEDNEN